MFHITIITTTTFYMTSNDYQHADDLPWKLADTSLVIRALPPAVAESLKVAVYPPPPNASPAAASWTDIGTAVMPSSHHNHSMLGSQGLYLVVNGHKSMQNNPSQDPQHKKSGNYSRKQR